MTSTRSLGQLKPTARSTRPYCNGVDYW